MKWRPLKHFCEGPPQYGLNTSADAYVDEGVRLLRTTDIQSDGSLSSDANAVFVAPEQVGPRHQLQRGDLLFSRAGSLGRCFRVDELAEPMTFAGYLVRFRPAPQTDPRYLEYCAAARFFQSHIESDAITSTISNFNAERYANLSLPDFSESAQRAIADFLDTETARIDALITKKRRMIDLLEERLVSAARAGLMGAWDAGSRSETGLPWLPEAPSSWDVAPVYSRFDVVLGRMVNAERTSTGDMRPYLRNANVRWDWVDVTDVAHMDFPAKERARYRLRQGDLLVCEGGAGVGRAGVWTGELEECYFQKSLHRVRPRRDWPVRWLVEWLRVCKYMGVLEGQGNLATIPHLTAEQLREHRLPMPDPGRCRQILARLDEARSAAAELQLRLECQIALLQEHRQALVTAAVTGELEVSGVAV